MVTPKDIRSQPLESVNVTLYGFCRCDEIKAFEMRLSSIIWMDPKCHHKCPYKRKAGISLVAQWIKLHTPNAGGPGFDPWSGN